jgi:hypothetical protein
VPPLGCRVYELPSLPVTTTCVAFVAATVNVDDPPETIVVGFALMLTVGVGFASTVTIAGGVELTVPPGPVAVAVYVVVAVGLTVCKPLVAGSPFVPVRG